VNQESNRYSERLDGTRPIGSGILIALNIKLHSVDAPRLNTDRESTSFRSSETRTNAREALIMSQWAALRIIRSNTNLHITLRATTAERPGKIV